MVTAEMNNNKEDYLSALGITCNTRSSKNKEILPGKKNNEIFTNNNSREHSQLGTLLRAISPLQKEMPENVLLYRSAETAVNECVPVATAVQVNAAIVEALKKCGLPLQAEKMVPSQSKKQLIVSFNKAVEMYMPSTSKGTRNMFYNSEEIECVPRSSSVLGALNLVAATSEPRKPLYNCPPYSRHRKRKRDLSSKQTKAGGTLPIYTAQVKEITNLPHSHMKPDQSVSSSNEKRIVNNFCMSLSSTFQTVGANNHGSNSTPQTKTGASEYTLHRVKRKLLRALLSAKPGSSLDSKTYSRKSAKHPSRVRKNKSDLRVDLMNNVSEFEKEKEYAIQDTHFCALCGDFTASMHHNVRCCADCYEVFSSTVLSGNDPRYNKLLCQPGPKHPQGCRSCHYYRCCSVGLDPQKVVKDEFKSRNEKLVKEKKVIANITLKAMLNGLLDAYTNTLMTKLLKDSTEFQQSIKGNSKTEVWFFLELTKTSHKIFSKFIQNIPGFEELESDEEQIIKKSSLELLVMHIIFDVSLSRRMKIVFPGGQLINFVHLLAPFKEVIKEIRHAARKHYFQLIDVGTEVLLRAITVLSGKTRLQKPNLVRLLYSKVLEALRHHISEYHTGRDMNLLMADLIVHLGMVRVIAAKILVQAKELAWKYGLAMPDHLVECQNTPQFMLASPLRHTNIINLP